MTVMDVILHITNLFLICWSIWFVVTYKLGLSKLLLATVVCFGSLFQSIVLVYHLINPTVTSTAMLPWANILGLVGSVTGLGLFLFGTPKAKSE